MSGERVKRPEPDRLIFGPFTLVISQRLLLRDGNPIQVGSRALDILIALVRRPGQIHPNRSLIRQVWGSVTVDEGALRVHINGLRKALRDGQDGARFIINVPGRGYSIVSSVYQANMASPPTMVLPSPRPELPPVPRGVVGRRKEIDEVVAQTLQRGLISLVGPGGIGKTTVALEALHVIKESFGNRIYFINLSAVTDPEVVYLSMASMLGVGSGSADVLNDLIDFLARSKCLMVLDSCEHLIEPVAALADAVRNHAPLTHLIVTTREPLRVEGELIIRLSSLECPPKGADQTAAECLTFPAVQLFVDRVTANSGNFSLSDHDAPIAAGICRRLDGIALALELCAGRVAAYGLTGTLELLERRLGLLWRGGRTAPLRHQTLHDTLDWSFGLLNRSEQTVFSRLSIFGSTFTLSGAEFVAADATISTANVVDIVAGLVSKSLISPLPGRTPMLYRLLDTTRTYAQEKLDERGDKQRTARCHAKFMISIFSSDPGREPKTNEFLDQINDVRSALEWCFGKEGDASLGVTLAAATVTPFLESALCDECYRWAALAISSLSPSQRASALELELQTALGWAAMFASGKGNEVQGAFTRGLAIAENEREAHLQLRLLNGLSFVLSRKGDHAAGLELAEQAAEIARRTSDETAMALADWALSVSHHLCGHQQLVLPLSESAALPQVTSPYSRGVADYGYDYRGRALIARARALWLMGFSVQAAAAAHFAIDEVGELSHPISVFVVLVYAATVFLWCEDWQAAQDTINRLRAHSVTKTLVYREIGAALEAMLDCRRSGSPREIEALRLSLKKLIAEGHLILVPLCRTTLADALISAGLFGEARRVMDGASDDQAHQVDGPEVLRIKGVVAAALHEADSGRDFIRRSIDLARLQSALALELRSTIWLVRTADAQSRGGAIAELAIVYNRFAEGLDSSDLKVAEGLLEDGPSHD